MKIGVNMD